MKKLLLLFIICFLAAPLYIFADEEDADNSKEKKPFRIKDRTVEFGFINTRVGFANDFLAAKDIFQEKVILDLDELKDGFRMNLDFDFTPFYFSYKSKKNWGFGLAVGIDTMGILNLSGDMLSFKEAEDEKSDASGAAFVDFQIPAYFHVKNIKVKIKPSLFFPIMYVKPDISYSLKDSPNGSIINMNYDIRVYTAFPMESGESFQLTASPGFDFCLGAEYQLAEAIGLKEKISFLDFFVGLDLINLPTVPAKLNDYMQMSGQIGDGDAIDVFNMGDSFVNIEDAVYGSESKNILRPFKMLAWMNWKPFEAVPVNFIPTIGFAVNSLYQKPGSLEAGIKTRFDLANLFIAELGVGYYDRLWKNSIDLALNFRFIEFYFGIDMRSQNFAKSWTGGGIGANVGIKFGG